MCDGVICIEHIIAISVAINIEIIGMPMIFRQGKGGEAQIDNHPPHHSVLNMRTADTGIRNKFM